MGKFLWDMIEVLTEIPSSMEKIIKAKEVLERLVVDNEEINIEEVLEMYDTRIYDFDSKQHDIKILKQIEFEGVYIIHNCTKDIFLVGKSKNVLRKIERQFKGYENKEVYLDYKKGDKFKIRIIDLKKSNYDNIDELVKNMTNQYGTYTIKKYVKVKNKEDRKGHDIKKYIFFGIMILVMCFSFFMAYLYSTPGNGEVKVTIGPKDYIGVNFHEVKENLLQYKMCT